MGSRFGRAWSLAVVGCALAIASCSGGGAASPSAGSSSGPTGVGSAIASPPAASGSPGLASGLPTPAESPSPTSSPAAPSTAAPPSASPVAPSAASLPADPPAASLRGTSVGTVEGRLGSYTWVNVGSDSPWIVGRTQGAARRGAKLRVEFGGVVPASWTVSWARVSGGAAGDPTGRTTGTGAIAFSAPKAAGDWSVAVTAVFAPGASATYFWHLTVTG